MELLFGASAGVMLSASFFSLLGPSVAYSKENGSARTSSSPSDASHRLSSSCSSFPLAWIPPLFGFLVGVAFIKLVDCFMPAGADPHHHSAPPSRSQSPRPAQRHKREKVEPYEGPEGETQVGESASVPHIDLDQVGEEAEEPKSSLTSSGHQSRQWTKKRVWLLVIAVTLHNIPEGIVLGVSYGSLVGEDSSSNTGPTLKDAILLTVALGTLTQGTGPPKSRVCSFSVSVQRFKIFQKD